jgi:lipoyl-dependent peroxiredoxin
MTARVHIEKVGDGFKITSIDLSTEAEVPGIDEQTFTEQAEATKKNCPVSQALAGTEINLQAKLFKSAVE